MFSSEQGELFTVDRDDKSDHCKVVSRIKVNIDNIVKSVGIGDDRIGNFSDKFRRSNIADIFDCDLRNRSGHTVAVGNSDGEVHRSGFRRIGEGEDTIGESSGDIVTVNIFCDNRINVFAITACGGDIKGKGVIAFALGDAVDGEGHRFDLRLIADGDGDTVFGGDIVLDTIDHDSIVNDRRTVDGQAAVFDTSGINDGRTIFDRKFDTGNGEVTLNIDASGGGDGSGSEGEIAFAGNGTGDRKRGSCGKHRAVSGGKVAGKSGLERAFAGNSDGSGVGDSGVANQRRVFNDDSADIGKQGIVGEFRFVFQRQRTGILILVIIAVADSLGIDFGVVEYES